MTLQSYLILTMVADKMLRYGVGKVIFTIRFFGIRKEGIHIFVDYFYVCFVEKTSCEFRRSSKKHLWSKNHHQNKNVCSWDTFNCWPDGEWYHCTSCMSHGPSLQTQNPHVINTSSLLFSPPSQCSSSSLASLGKVTVPHGKTNNIICWHFHVYICPLRWIMMVMGRAEFMMFTHGEPCIDSPRYLHR